MPKKSTINQAKYDSANCKNYHLKLVYKTDKDIIEKLSSVSSMQGYIKQLIRDDIRKENREEGNAMFGNDDRILWEGYNPDGIRTQFVMDYMGHVWVCSSNNRELWNEEYYTEDGLPGLKLAIINEGYRIS